MTTGLTGLYARRAREVQASAIREICKLIARPEIRSLAGGWPDPETFPVAAIREITSRVLAERPHLALQYGTSEGLPELRQELARWVGERDGIQCNADQLVITAGSAQGMELAAKTLLEEGDVAFVGLPTYFGGSGACQTFGAELVGVPLDDDGMIPEALEARIIAAREAGKRAKLIYVIPDFQNPTGATLSKARRIRIMELAREHDLAVIEDNPYRDLSYEGEPLPPLRAWDEDRRVIYLRSFSKIFCPGFRLALAIGHADVIRRMVIARQFEDCCAGVLGQYVLLEFVRQGLLDQQIARNREHYRAKRDHLLAALDRYFPDTVTWNRPRGGFFVFVHLPAGLDGEELLHEAVGQDVAYVAGAPFFVDGTGRQTIRLSFAQSDAETMEAAVAVLGRLLQKRTRAAARDQVEGETAWRTT